MIVIAVFGGSPTNDEVIAFRDEHGTIFPLVSPDGGSSNVVYYYGVEAYPATVLIKPDRSVIWSDATNDLSNISTIVSLGPQQNACPEDWPIADFSGDPLVIPINTGVTFTDESQNPISEWIWTFDNGTPNNFNGQTPPEIIYDVAGYHDVRLTARNEFGNENSITKSDYILVYEIADTLQNQQVIFS